MDANLVVEGGLNLLQKSVALVPKLCITEYPEYNPVEKHMAHDIIEEQASSSESYTDHNATVN